MQSLLILGRQPELGLAELESLYGADKLSLLSSNVVLVDVDPCLLAFKRLGGSLKFAKLLTILPFTDWSKIEEFLVGSSPSHTLNMPPGKMTLGLSLYGFSINVRTISKSALNIKRAIQKTGRSVRNVPNKSAELNTAQVIHNKLTADRSWELLIIKAGNQTYVAQTIMVQDIEAYAKRDQQRPSRDTKVGMLPPKLAQIIINLAVGQLPEDKLKSICDVPANETQIVSLDQTILDPFCGSGVILQEAALMGYDIIGTDISSRMVDYSKNNLSWLNEKFGLNTNLDNLSALDATKGSWPDFDFLASETDLGKPLSSRSLSNDLNQVTNEMNKLISDFLTNLAKESKAGTRICLAVPAWQIAPDKFKFLPLIDQITDLGYNRIEFKHNGSKELIYYRPDQTVGRQLLTLVRK